jgi:hypothetical protein
MSFLDSDDPAKILLIGDQGQGKTGAKAALVAAGYKLRMVDADRGARILRSLLTDPRYPYADYMKKAGIDPREPGRISVIPIDVDFDIVSTPKRDAAGRTTFTDMFSPTSSKAWNSVVKLVKHWVEPDGTDYGSMYDWGPDTILDFDTMSTLAEIAKYWCQDLNGHLGAIIDEHGRDTGGAQEMIMRLMSAITNSKVACNVIVTAHIKRVDMSNDVPQSAEQRLRDKKPLELKGFPMVIGQAVSPYIGKKFNDQFVVERTGNGKHAERRIHSVPVSNTDTKNSAFVDPEYSLESGLAEIFAALRQQPYPEDLVKAIRPKKFLNGTNGESESKPKAFGTKL